MRQGFWSNLSIMETNHKNNRITGILACVQIKNINLAFENKQLECGKRISTEFDLFIYTRMFKCWTEQYMYIRICTTKDGAHA